MFALQGLDAWLLNIHIISLFEVRVVNECVSRLVTDAAHSVHLPEPKIQRPTNFGFRS